MPAAAPGTPWLRCRQVLLVYPDADAGRKQVGAQPAHDRTVAAAVGQKDLRVLYLRSSLPLQLNMIAKEEYVTWIDALRQQLGRIFLA